MLWQPSLPERYTVMSDQALAEAIAARRRELGSSLIILGHHYQQDEVIRFADYTGDSFKLSQLAAERVARVGARYVVFAGVHFMAESADILANPEGEAVSVILPDLGAGCSMADMADGDMVNEAWQTIHDCAGPGVRLVPVCYMNSSAAIKAFCGEHGGAVCTSSNADKVLRWALAGGAEGRADGRSVKVLFIPDQHLGRNTAFDLGYDLQRDMCVWDPKAEGALGGNDVQTLRRATFVLWKGHCSVHKLFRPEHVDRIRSELPGVTVIVHPECVHEVVQRSDMTGSTEGIIRAITDAPPGSRWAVGTEVHLVNRLAREAAGRGVEVRILSGCQCLCTTMFRIDMPHLLWVLDHLAQGQVVNRIRVDGTVKRWAMIALERMLRITAGVSPDAPTTAAVNATATV